MTGPTGDTVIVSVRADLVFRRGGLKKTGPKREYFRWYSAAVLGKMLYF